MAKTVFIMGATSGIGEALAERFASLGCAVAIAGRRAERLEEISARLAKTYGTACFTSVIDLREEDAEEKILDLSEKAGGTDLYFQVAGFGHKNPELDSEIELETAETNMIGFMRSVNAGMKILKANPAGGQLAAVSSVAGVRGLGISPAYSAAKAMQSRYLEALRQMVNSKDLPITITDIRPGFVDTPFLSGHKYPMTMPLSYAADIMMKAVLNKKRVAWIDWKYQLLGAAMCLIPGIVWENIPVGFVPLFKKPGEPAKTEEAEKAEDAAPAETEETAKPQDEAQSEETPSETPEEAEAPDEAAEESETPAEEPEQEPKTEKAAKETETVNAPETEKTPEEPKTEDAAAETETPAATETAEDGEVTKKE